MNTEQPTLTEKSAGSSVFPIAAVLVSGVPRLTNTTVEVSSLSQWILAVKNCKNVSELNSGSVLTKTFTVQKRDRSIPHRPFPISGPLNDLVLCLKVV